MVLTHTATKYIPVLTYQKELLLDTMHVCTLNIVSSLPTLATYHAVNSSEMTQVHTLLCPQQYSNVLVFFTHTISCKQLKHVTLNVNLCLSTGMWLSFSPTQVQPICQL